MTWLYTLSFWAMVQLPEGNLGLIFLPFAIIWNVLFNLYFLPKHDYYKRILLVGVLSLFSIYLVANNMFNDNPVFKGVVWWFAFFLFLLFDVRKDLAKQLVQALTVALFVLVLDTLYRVSLVEGVDVVANYYVYKKNSLLGVDSNVAGLYGVVCFSLLMAYRKVLSRSQLVIFGWGLFVLIVLTLSKAAVLSVLVLLSYSYLRRTAFCVVSVLSIFMLFFIAINNESGSSKFDLLRLSFEFVEMSSYVDLVFGLGLGRVVFLENGLTPHLLALQLILYLGVVGVVLYFAMWIGSFFASGGRLMYLFIPYMLISLSFSPLGFPPLVYAILFFVRYKKVVA